MNDEVDRSSLIAHRSSFMYSGFLNIDKPAGVTSHDVVARIRRLAGQRRVGHGGTLDPAATGVLPVALGGATRLVEYLVEGRKGYRGIVRLGVSTTTDDAEGEVLDERPVGALSRATLEAAVRRFVGEIMQTPPAYSAIKVAGRRMYDLARRGEAVALEPRPVRIERIEVMDWRAPLLTLDIVCGKGTYIRSLARDLGATLGCGAHLAALRRTMVGPLTLATALPLAELEEKPAYVRERLLPPEAAVADWPRIDLDDAATGRVLDGLALPVSTGGEHARAHAAGGELVALLRRDGELWRPFKVFGTRNDER